MRDNLFLTNWEYEEVKKGRKKGKRDDEERINFVRGNGKHE